MKDKQVSILGSGLIWFGAAVSIAEILTGTLIAPLGFEKGITAILLGHVIGCVLLYLAGLIGAKTQKSAMETVKGSFSQKGSILFSLLNITQLLGWTAVMIIAGARAATVIIEAPLNIPGTIFWSIIIGALILLWLLVGIKNSSKLHLFTISALFLATGVLSAVVFKGDSVSVLGNMSFGSAVELSVAMPLSWLPLISDYVKIAKKPQKAPKSRSSKHRGLFLNQLLDVYHRFGSCDLHWAVGYCPNYVTGRFGINWYLNYYFCHCYNDLFRRLFNRREFCKYYKQSQG